MSVLTDWPIFWKGSVSMWLFRGRKKWTTVQTRHLTLKQTSEVPLHYYTSVFSVNQFICSYLSLSHEHSETLSALKFMRRTTNSANVLAALSANSLTAQRQIYKKAFVPSQENYLRAPHSTHIRVYYDSDKIKSSLFVFAALCGNEMILSSIKDFFSSLTWFL